MYVYMFSLCYKSEAGSEEFNTSVVCLLFPTGLIHYNLPITPAPSPRALYTLSQMKFTVSRPPRMDPWTAGPRRSISFLRLVSRPTRSSHFLVLPILYTPFTLLLSSLVNRTPPHNITPVRAHVAHISKKFKKLLSNKSCALKVDLLHCLNT